MYKSISKTFFVFTLACLTICFSLKAGLVARYQFDDASSGTFCNTARSGLLKGSASKVYDSTRASNVLSCGANYGSYVSLGTLNPSEGTDELTIAAWIKWNGPASYPCGILSKRTEFFANMMWSFGISSASNKLLLQSTYDTVSSTNTLPIGQWAHVAVTLTADGEVAFYIDGVLAGTASAFDMGTGTLAELCVGSFQGYWYGLNGLMDDLRIYNAALSETEIGQIYNLTYTDSNIIAKYEFDESGTTVYDTSTIGTLCGSAATVYNADMDSDVLNCSANYNKYASVGNYNPSWRTDELTISAWVKWNGSTGNMCGILSKRTDYNTNMMWTFAISSTSGKLILQSNTRTIYSDDTIPVGQWTHVAVTLTADAYVRFYINGNFSGEAFSFGINNGTTASIWLGSVQNAWYCLNGYLDDVQVYDMALSEDAVKRIVDSSLLSMTVYASPVYKATNVSGTSPVLKWLSNNDGSYYDVCFVENYTQVETFARLAGDVNGDNVVDNNDLSLFTAALLNGSQAGQVLDFDSDGDIDNDDQEILETNYGQTHEAPEIFKGTINGTSYSPGNLSAGEYFWRIDRVKDGRLIKGQVWSFVCDGSLAKEVFNDSHIQRQVRVYDVNMPATPVELFDFNNSALSPKWVLAQWDCAYSLEDYTTQNVGDWAVKYADTMKSVTFSKFGHPYSDFTMEIDSRYHYGTTQRIAGQPWPHLLLSQGLSGRNVKLSELAGLKYHLEAKLLYSQRFEYTGYTTLLHAAQFQQFITVQNLNPESSGYGQYLWFGIGIYDDRSDPNSPPTIGSPYIAADLGTGALLYVPTRGVFTSENIATGEWITLEADLLPLMLDAVEEAWDRGFLSGSQDIDDYELGDTNIGWEIPGINNVGIQFRNMSLKAIY